MPENGSWAFCILSISSTTGNFLAILFPFADSSNKKKAFINFFGLWFSPPPPNSHDTFQKIKHSFVEIWKCQAFDRWWDSKILRASSQLPQSPPPLNWFQSKFHHWAGRLPLPTAAMQAASSSGVWMGWPGHPDRPIGAGSMGKWKTPPTPPPDLFSFIFQHCHACCWLGWGSGGLALIWLIHPNLIRFGSVCDGGGEILHHCWGEAVFSCILPLHHACCLLWWGRASHQQGKMQGLSPVLWTWEILGTCLYKSHYCFSPIVLFPNFVWPALFLSSVPFQVISVL